MTLKNKINLYLIISIILSVCLIVLVIYPLFKEIKNSSEELVYEKQKLLSLEKKIENLKEFQTLWLKIEPNLKKIDQLFIDPQVPVEFVNFLEKIAKDSEILIEISSALSSKTEKDPWPSLLLQINSTAPFSKFLKFLEKIEASPYLIEIQDLNARGLIEGDTEITLSIKVYTSR